MFSIKDITRIYNINFFNQIRHIILKKEMFRNIYTFTYNSKTRRHTIVHIIHDYYIYIDSKYTIEYRADRSGVKSTPNWELILYFHFNKKKKF